MTKEFFNRRLCFPLLLLVHVLLPCPAVLEPFGAFWRM
jgi:hypothetical protein